MNFYTELQDAIALSNGYILNFDSKGVMKHISIKKNAETLDILLIEYPFLEAVIN